MLGIILYFYSLHLFQSLTLLIQMFVIPLSAKNPDHCNNDLQFLQH